MKISLKKLLPKSSKEIYMEEVYGPNGLFVKYDYVCKILDSCKTYMQYVNCKIWIRNLFNSIRKPNLTEKYKIRYNNVLSDIDKKLETAFDIKRCRIG